MFTDMIRTWSRISFYVVCFSTGNIVNNLVTLLRYNEDCDWPIVGAELKNARGHYGKIRENSLTQLKSCVNAQSAGKKRIVKC